MKTETILMGVAGAVAAYLSVPIIMRLRSGCPPFASKMVDAGGGQMVQACKPLRGADLLLWPIGFVGYHG